MSRSPCAGRCSARFRAVGRGGAVDRPARGDDRIDRVWIRRAATNRKALAGATGMLRFDQACNNDAAVFPAGCARSTRQDPPMSGFSTARQKTVDGQVRPSDGTDIRIIDAMLAGPRKAFVPENQRAMAYLDLDLDVSDGGSLKRFLIKPVVIAKMLQAADIGETDNVLGAGCAPAHAR